MGNHASGEWSNVRSGTLVAAMQNLCGALGTEAGIVLGMMATNPEGLAKRMAVFALNEIETNLSNRECVVPGPDKILSKSNLESCFCKTIKLGVNLPLTRQDLERANVGVSDCAGEMLRNPAFSASPTEQEVDLGLISPKMLGFSGMIKQTTFFDLVVALGCRSCTPEVGPQLCLQGLPQGTLRVTVAMSPALRAKGGINLFRVSQYTGGGPKLWLESVRADSEVSVSADNHFVFVLPRAK